METVGSRAGVDDLIPPVPRRTFECRLPFSQPLLSPKNKFQNIFSVELSYKFNIFHLVYSKF